MCVCQIPAVVEKIIPTYVGTSSQSARLLVPIFQDLLALAVEDRTVADGCSASENDQSAIRATVP